MNLPFGNRTRDPLAQLVRKWTATQSSRSRLGAAPLFPCNPHDQQLRAHGITCIARTHGAKKQLLPGNSFPYANIECSLTLGMILEGNVCLCIGLFILMYVNVCWCMLMSADHTWNTRVAAGCSGLRQGFPHIASQLVSEDLCLSSSPGSCARECSFAAPGATAKSFVINYTLNYNLICYI
jgi:hypothetical protein